MPISSLLAEDVPLLEVKDLTVSFAAQHGRTTIVSDVSLSIPAGKTLGLVGESGCGKSTLTRAILRLIDADSGSIKVQGNEWSGLTRRQMISNRQMAQLIFQDPYSSLNPRWRVGRLLEEPLIIHGIGDAAERKQRVDEMLAAVGLPEDALTKFSHQFSGGQRQRISIARALILRPKLVICDEPVSALDVSVQAQILNLLVDLQERFGITYLFVSHDLAVVEYIADAVAVMENGRIVESGATQELLRKAAHPYTRRLLASGGYQAYQGDDGKGLNAYSSIAH